MKKLISLFLVIITFLSVIALSGCNIKEKPIDEILSFDIYVNPNDDATIDFRYHIKWKVLDLDEDKQGVTWVYIGIPNRYCSNITKLSSDIDKAYYSTNDSETVIKVELIREYLKGEVIDIDFSFHQTHLFTYGMDENNINKLVTFSYIPGWFDKIDVDSLTVYWSKNIEAYYSNCKREDENYYIWEGMIPMGQKSSPIDVSYSLDKFPNINAKDTYAGNKDTRVRDTYLTVIGIIIIILIVIAFIRRLFRRPSYYRTRGFYPYGRRFFFRYFYYGVDDQGSRKTNPYVYTGGSGHSSGHSCACACACACAGGGRAGCSKKDFYKGKIDINKFLEEDK